MQPDLSLELPNDVRAIQQAVEYLVERSRAAGFDDPDRLRLNLRVSLSEALANAMLNGNRRDPEKRVRLEARLAPRRLVIRVTDEGGGFDPQTLPDPTLPEHRVQGSGRGIFLIRNLMDAVEFNERGNAITMVLERGDGEPEKESA
ncbi:MAG TPA: ATP-binding protein [Longimicrobiales bacterium]